MKNVTRNLVFFWLVMLYLWSLYIVNTTWTIKHSIWKSIFNIVSSSVIQRIFSKWVWNEFTSVYGLYYNDSKNNYFLKLSKKYVYFFDEINKKWNKRIEIVDTNNDTCHINNRPISIFINEWNLILNVIDTCWWWSMEWTITSLKLRKNGTFKLVWCYDYSNRWQFYTFVSDEEIESWWAYIDWTTQFQQLELLPLSTCKNHINIIYHN